MYLHVFCVEPPTPTPTPTQTPTNEHLFIAPPQDPMYPNQAGRAQDKENDIVSEGNAGRSGAGGPGGLHANLVKQTSLLGNRTPSKPQNQQQGPKKNPYGAKTPMQQGKVSNLGPNSPSGKRHSRVLSSGVDQTPRFILS